MVIKSNNNNILTSKKNNNYKFIENFRAAPFLDRVAAFIIDYFIIISPVATLFLSPFKKQLGLSALMGSDLNGYIIYFNIGVVIFALSFFYNFLFTYFFNATLGQIFLRLKVESIIKGEKLSFFDSILRALFFTISIFFLGLPFLLTLTHKGKRSLHGLVSDTYVYSVNKYKKTKIASVFASRFALVCCGVLGFFIFLSAIQTVLGLSDKQDFTGSVALCDEVDESIKNWPEQSEVQPERLSVAMALYAIEGADKSCLEKEVNYVFESGEEAGLAYLANAFVHADKADISDSYLEKVCELDEKSETCMMSKVIDNWATDNLDLVKYTLQRIKGDSVYVNLWKSRFLISEGDYEKAFDVIASLPKIKALSRYTSMNKAKLYWFKGKYEQAKIVTDMIIEKEITSDSQEIAGWLCFEELEKSCSEQTSSSCKFIDSQVKDGALAGVAIVASLECNGQLASHHKYNWDPEVKALINYKLNKEGEPRVNFESFIAQRFSDQRVPYLAVTSFLNKTPLIDDDLFEKIKEHTGSLSMRFERLKLSNKFLSHLVDNKYYDFAFSFGEQFLDPNSPVDYVKNLVVSAYFSGDIESAKIYLGKINSDSLGKPAQRGIASNSQFNFVKKIIEEEK